MNAQKLEQKRTRRGVDGVDGDSPENNVATKAMMSKITSLERDLERRQESYISRERAYKAQILELEREVLGFNKTKTVSMKPDSRMMKLKSMQDQIIKNVEQTQDRTCRVLQEQEKDLVRSYRARLFDLQNELDKEKNKKEDGAGAWIERNRKLESEVEWVKEVADRLERLNQTLVIDNNRLKSQFKSQEEDRTFLITQLVNVKKENAHLKAEYLAASLANETLRKQRNLDQEMKGCESGFINAVTSKDPSSRSKTGDAVAEKSASNGKYKDTKERLRGLLIVEKKNLHAVRANYAAEMQSRTELETLLRHCVDDVRKEISSLSPRHNDTAMSSSHALSVSAPLLHLSFSCFQKCDRERTLELLLSQERVLHLLGATTFPASQRSTFGNECAVSDRCYTSQNTVKPDEFLCTGTPERASTAKSDKTDDFYDDDSTVCGIAPAPIMVAATSNFELSCAVSDGIGTRLPAI